MKEAARIGLKTHVQTWPFEEVNEALAALKSDSIRGAGVIQVKS